MLSFKLKKKVNVIVTIHRIAWARASDISDSSFGAAPIDTTILLVDTVLVEGELFHNKHRMANIRLDELNFFIWAIWLHVVELAIESIGYRIYRIRLVATIFKWSVSLKVIALVLKSNII